MRWVALALVAPTAGCHLLFSLDEVPDSGALLSCANATPAPVFCADFDDDDGVVYSHGIASALPPAPAGVTVERRQPAMSPPNALWIDAQTATYAIMLDDTTPNVTRLHARLAMLVERFDPGTSAAEVIEIGVRDPSFNSCTARLQIEPMGPRIDLQSVCNGTRADVMLLSSVPVGWTNYKLDFNIATGQVSASVNDQVTAVQSLGLVSLTGGAPRVAAGVLFVNTIGPLVALDDVVVDIPP